MEHIKMAVTEEKNAIVYTFGYANVDRSDELTWVNNAVVARRTGDKWTFQFNGVKEQSQGQFQTYQKLLEKVNQVVETNAMNLMGITVEKPKPAPVAAKA